MPIRNQNWYDLQEGRRYPLDDRSTGEDDNGAQMRDNILVDCHLRFPSTAGQHAFVQGITISEAIVSVLFGVAQDLNDTSGTTIAAITQPLSGVSPGVNYSINALVPGVAGWVTFGRGLDEPFVGRYSAPAQSVIAPRCARPYTPLPIPTLGKLNVATSLQGLVTFLGTAPVEITYEQPSIGSEAVDAVVFRLAKEFQNTNPLQTYLGACGERPESGTCAKPPLETINGVGPDCNGNINLLFDGFNALPYANCGGLDVLTDTGLAEACRGGRDEKYRPKDLCNSTSDSSDYWYNPLEQLPGPTILSSESLTNPGYSDSCAVLPLCVDFSDGVAGNRFNTIQGLFVYETVDAPDTCSGVVNSSSLSLGSDGLASHMVYAAAYQANRNIALFKNCGDFVLYDKTVSTELQLTKDSLRANGGIILNYLQAIPYLQIPDRYVAVELDADTHKLRVVRWTGSKEVVEQEVAFAVVPGYWYRLSAQIVDAGTYVIINAAVEGVDIATQLTTLSAVVTEYGDPVGLSGLYSKQAYTRFNKFEISG